VIAPFLSKIVEIVGDARAGKNLCGMMFSLPVHDETPDINGEHCYSHL